MTRYALIAALLGCLGLGASLWWVVAQRDAAQAEATRLAQELDTATARIAQMQAAAEIHTAFIARMQADAAKGAATETEFLSKEGGDAPLPDFLRDALDRVR